MVLLTSSKRFSHFKSLKQNRNEYTVELTLQEVNFHQNFDSTNNVFKNFSMIFTNIQSREYDHYEPGRQFKLSASCYLVIVTQCIVTFFRKELLLGRYSHGSCKRLQDVGYMRVNSKQILEINTIARVFKMWYDKADNNNIHYQSQQ